MKTIGKSPQITTIHTVHQSFKTFLRQVQRVLLRYARNPKRSRRTPSENGNRATRMIMLRRPDRRGMLRSKTRARRLRLRFYGFEIKFRAKRSADANLFVTRALSLIKNFRESDLSGRRRDGSYGMFFFFFFMGPPG